MNTINYYIVDVFANAKYEGNQLAVFLDLANCLSGEQMQRIAREINFAETTFIKANKNNQRFVVRIFTPEHEVPFAGHPSLGTSYIIAKFLVPEPLEKLTLELAHSDIVVSISDPFNIDESIFSMRQTQPELRETFAKDDIANALEINPDCIDPTWPIQEISTGLPYIIIPLTNLAAISRLTLTYSSFKNFLISKDKYRTNSATGHSTSLFFFTKDTCFPENDYHARMLLIENDKVSEDAATGSANSCLLAYLLMYDTPTINAVVEQGFEVKRKSCIYLDGKLVNDQYTLNVGGRNKLVSEGVWFV